MVKRLECTRNGSHGHRAKNEPDTDDHDQTVRPVGGLAIRVTLGQR